MRILRWGVLVGAVIVGGVSVGLRVGYAGEEEDSDAAPPEPAPDRPPAPGGLPSATPPGYLNARPATTGGRLPVGGVEVAPVLVEEGPGLTTAAQRRAKEIETLRRQLDQAGLSPEEIEAEVQRRMGEEHLLGAVDARVGGIEGADLGAAAAPAAESSWPGTPAEQAQEPEKRFFKRMEPKQK